MITSEAMIVICTMMRILVGIWFRNKLTSRFENSSTKMTAAHMTSAVSILVVTASAEQIPSTCSVIGLLLKSGSVNASLDLDISQKPPPRAGASDRAPIHPALTKTAAGS